MGGEHQDATIDPVPAPRGTSPSGPLLLTLDLLFHSDLRRIGGRAILGRADEAGPARILGRDGPLFSSPDGGPPLPLLDPCISRKQLQLRYDPVRGLFRLTPDAGARRPLAFFDAQGNEIAAPSGEVPAGTLVAIGDRVLLGLGLRPAGQPAQGPELTGLGEAIEQLRRRITALAALDDTVLVEGPTGAGKERAAQALHRWGPRARGPFLAVNCAAIPETLVESELFGHAKGAFSGAAASKEGLFQAADGGTLFLDEVGELPLSTQAKLLRVLQDHRVRPVGSRDEVEVRVRVVAATNRDLLRDAQAGRFREDLFARLEGFCVAVPALGARREDIPVLLAHFLLRRVAAGQATWLLRAANEYPPPLPLSYVLGLLRYDWPRNVRELERFASALALANDGVGSFVALQPGDACAEQEPPAAAPRVSEEELRRLLDEHEYVPHRVAKAIGVSTTTIDRWLRDYRITRPCDLAESELRAAVEQAQGDLAAAARGLRISLRGLKLRLRELGLSDRTAKAR